MQPIDLLREITDAGDRRIVWSESSDDLNVNLIVLGPEDKIEEHRNDEVDVLIVAMSGRGEIMIDGVASRLSAGSIVIVSRGANRSVIPVETPFGYLTCHRQRAKLWPQVKHQRDRSPGTHRH